MALLDQQPCPQGVYCQGMHHANCLLNKGMVAPHRLQRSLYRFTSSAVRLKVF